MWYLNGALMNHPKLAISYDGIAPMNSFSFETFWTWFAQLAMANDILSFETFKDGFDRMIAEAWGALLCVRWGAYPFLLFC